MPSLERLPSSSGFAPILLANLLPLVGVVQFGWDASTIIMIYALEVILAIPLAMVKALFAQQPPRTDDDDDDSGTISASNELTQKRGGVSVVSWLPPIYPRTIGFVSDVIFTTAWAALFLGAALSHLFPVVEVLSRPEVLVSAVGLLAAQAIDIRREYFRGGRYKTVSPKMVLETPVSQATFFAFFLFSVLVAGVDTALFLAAFVLGKLLVDWSAFQASHGNGGRLSDWFAGPTEAATPTDPPSIPDNDIVARVSADITSVFYTGAFRLVHILSFYNVFFVMLGIPFVLLVSGESTTLLIGSTLAILGIYVFVVASEFAEFYLVYAPIEYRRYGDHLVAYDTWLEEPQWSIPTTDLRNLEVVRDRLPDHLLGTRTIAATAGWGGEATERYIGPVADPDALRDVLDVSVLRTDIEPFDRRYAAVAVVPFVYLVGSVGFAVSPIGSLDMLLNIVFLFPFLLVVLDWVWRQGYPDHD